MSPNTCYLSPQSIHPWRGEGRVGVMEVEIFMQGLGYENPVKGYYP
jgi:alpha-D-ribose 1-methylphosphonate 5-triphosphate synthase subunit PhnI